MKKLIAISVVFALVAGVAFAVELTGTVFGHVNVIEGSTAKDANGDSAKVTASGGMDRVRIDGSGEAGDGEFGGYIRYQGGDVGVDSAYAWWKPIDQFKLIIGNFSDAFWGKEGVTGWGFNQMPNDSSIATNYGIWCGNGWGSSVYLPDSDDGLKAPWAAYLHNRYTFVEGFQETGAGIEITPMDMLAINIGIPFISKPRTPSDPEKDKNEAAVVFQSAFVQFSLNLDFGNIAITYDGANRAGIKAHDGGAIFAYFGGSFGDLGIDFGVGYHLKDSDDENAGPLPIGVGVGVKYATDSFGVKFRTTAALAGGDDEHPEDQATYINASVLPFFTISDSMSAFVNIGLGMLMPKDGDSNMGWYFNPYLRVGAEWGPTFYFGIKAESPFKPYEADGLGDAFINWSVPIALMVSF